MPMENGRLVKKENTELLKKVDIEEYKWLEFNAQTHMFADNPRKSVVLAEFHDPAEISKKVRDANEFKTPLGEKSKTLTPIDLQKDYEQSQREMMIRKRRRLLDEEEAIAQELAELVLGEEDKKKASRWSSDGQEGSEKEAHQQASSQAKPASEHSDVLKETAAAAEQHVSEKEMRELPKAKNVHPISLSDVGHSFDEIKRQALEESQKAGYDEGFNSGFAEGKAAGHEEGLKAGEGQGFEQGKAEGQEQGYSEGLAKAQAELDAKSDHYFDLLSKSLSEIEKLRSEVLATGQDIFIEITKVAAEKLLRHQMKFSDETLKKLFKDVVDNYAEKDFIQVEMNPEDAKRIKGHLEQEKVTKVKIKENAALLPGDFKVEVDSEMVVMELRKGIDALIERIAPEIFSGEEPSENKTTDETGKKVS